LILIPVMTTSPSTSSLSPRTRPGFGLRLWRVIASPWWTLFLLLLLALAIILSLLFPQAESTSVPIQGQWLAVLQGRYGRWTGLLSSLGLFDITHALWLQVLLVLIAYQSLVAAAEGCGQAWRWLHLGAEPSLQLPSSHAWERGVTVLPSPLAQGMVQVQSAFQRLGYQVRVAQDKGRALLEAMRYPWLTLGRPLAHGGVVLACMAWLLGGRLDWQEGPVTLSPGQGYGLRHVPGMTLRLEKVGLARGSSEFYSWVSLLRGEQVLCTGAISPARVLSCEGMHILAGGTEPALHITGHDRAGYPLALQPLQGVEAATPEVILPLPSYLSDRYVALPEGGLVLHIEVPSGQARPLFRLEVYHGQQSTPLLQRDITEPTSLSLDDLTLNLSPMRVPSFQVYHHPTWPLRWAGLSLALAGLLVSLALSPFHLWAQIEEREGEVCLCLWQGLPLPFGVPAIREVESQMDFPSPVE